MRAPRGGAVRARFAASGLKSGSTRLQNAPVAGATDLLEPVNRLLREENPFPLTGIVLVSPTDDTLINLAGRFTCGGLSLAP